MPAGLEALQVDLPFILKLEGNQRRTAYVPNPEGSKSGVTIATGFDLGARGVADLEKMGLPRSLIDKLEKYLGKKKQEAVKFLRENPLTITQAEADAIDCAQQEGRAPGGVERLQPGRGGEEWPAPVRATPSRSPDRDRLGFLPVRNAQLGDPQILESRHPTALAGGD